MRDNCEKYSYLPIFCDLRGKSVVVIGGGGVAERKIMTLLQAGSHITLISPEVTASLAETIREGLIVHIPRNFRPGDLNGAWLVIAATSDKDVQDAVFREAQGKRIFCNVVDEPRVCSFIVPSTVRRDDLCLAISTGGKSPALAKALRKDLEQKFGAEWGIFVSLLGRLRNLIIEKHEGQTVFEQCSRLADLTVPQWIRQKRWKQVENWAVEICGDKARPVVQEFAQNG